MPHSLSGFPPRSLRVVAVVGAALLALMLLIAGWMLLDARHTVHAQARQAVENVTLGLEQDLRRTLEVVDLSLRTTIAGIQLPELSTMSVQAQRAVLFDGAVAAEGVGSVVVTDAAGQVILDSASPTPRLINIADRRYFQTHRERADAGLIISEPLRSRADKQWVITLTRRVNHPDGSFAGVAIATFRLAHIRTLFAGLELGERGNVSLFSTDRYVVVRRPFDEGVIGRDARNAAVFDYLAQNPVGTFEAVASVDGVHRLYAYRRIGQLPLVISVGVSTAEIYAGWTTKTGAISLALVLLAGMAGKLGWWLMRELRLRRLAEQVAQRSKQELAASLVRFDALFRNSADALFTIRVETDGALVHDTLNPAMEALTGQPAAAVIGRTPEAYLPPDAAQLELAQWQLCVDTCLPVHYCTALDLPAGRREWEIQLIPVLNGAVRVASVIGTARDVTERNQSEAELRRLNKEFELQVTKELATREAARVRATHAERVQVLSQLAGGMARDFNNVLQTMGGSIALIERRPGDATGVRHLARRALDAAERGTAVTRRLLALSRQDELRAEPVDATVLIHDLRDTLAPALDTRTRVCLELEADLHPLLADKGQLEAVLLDLATNARDAMPDGGVLTLSAAAEEVRAGAAGHPAGLVPGRYVRLTVTDTGTGMSAATQSRALDPFSTTKPVGQSTGLSLSMAEGFAEQSGGSLSVESLPGRGTTVTLWLPQVTASLRPTFPTTVAAALAPLKVRLSRPCLLLVEDDEIVRAAIEEQLADEHDMLEGIQGDRSTDSVSLWN